MSDNQAISDAGSVGGGGLAFSGSGRPVVSRCVISGNTASSGAGAAHTASGGGLVSETQVTVSRTTISDNTVRCDDGVTIGGGVYAHVDSSWDRCAITGNGIKGLPATAFGVGIYLLGGASSLRDCSITGNALENVLQSAVGGGLAVAGTADATLTRCVVSNNTLYSDRTYFAYYSGLAGGGVSTHGTLKMYGCSLVENVVNARNSGICKGAGYAQLAGTGTLRNTLILGNKAQGDRFTTQGGGLSVSSGALGIANCVVVANHISGGNNGTGAGIHVVGGGASATVVNCAFVANSVDTGVPSSGGGGASCWNGGTLIIANSLFRNNAAPSEPQISPYGSTVKVSYSNVQGGILSGVTNDGHNIDADPLFFRAPLTNGNSDYGDLRLAAGSPSVNTGNASAAGIAPYDLEGYRRNQGGAPDMGPFEYRQDTAPVYDFYVDGVAGNDANSGVAAAPFQTVARALSVTDSMGRAVIHVKQGNYGGDRPHVDGPVQIVNWTGTGRASIGKP